MPRGGKPDYEPTPIDILIGCQRIQRTWTATEERSRRVGVPTEPVAYQVPTVPTRIGGRDVTEE